MGGDRAIPTFHLPQCYKPLHPGMVSLFYPDRIIDAKSGVFQAPHISGNILIKGRYPPQLCDIIPHPHKYQYIMHLNLTAMRREVGIKQKKPLSFGAGETQHNGRGEPVFLNPLNWISIKKITNLNRKSIFKQISIILNSILQTRIMRHFILNCSI
jgi:hypothetical protein